MELIFKGTPAPWTSEVMNFSPKTYGSTIDLYSVFDEDNYKHVASIWGQDACNNEKTATERDANAALIASAPELLQACIEMVENHALWLNIGDNPNNSREDEVVEEMYNKMRDAIHKALNIK